MPVAISSPGRWSPPMRQITRGPRKGEFVPIYEVKLPGWDDIIHLTPTALLSDEDRRRQQVKMITAMQSSPTPAIASHFTQLATQIDNIQDAMVGLSVLGRIATKVAGRAIPGVGLITTAADVLNAINIFYPPIPGIHSLPSLTHIRAGGKRLRRWDHNLDTKRQFGLLAGMNTGTYAQRLKETLKTGKIGFGWGEAFQILQVTDQVAGVGVSLGPIFGAMQDSFFGLLRGARFDLSGPLQFVAEAVAPIESALFAPFLPSVYSLPERYQAASQIRVSVDWPGALPLIDDLYGRPRGSFERDVELTLGPVARAVDPYVARAAATLATYEKAAINAATTVFNASKWIVGLRGVLTWEQHIEILAAQFLALQTIQPFLQQTDWGFVAGAMVQKPVALESIPFAPRSSTGSVGALSAALRDGPAKFPLDWLHEAPSPDAELFGHALVDAFVDLLWDCLEGPGPYVDVRSPDHIRAVVLIHDYDLLPPFDRTDEQLREYLDLVTAAVAASDGGFPSVSVVREIWIHSFPGVEID